MTHSNPSYPIENQDARDKKVDKLTDKTVGETDNAGDKAGGNTRGLEKQQHDTDKEYLNDDQNANYAKDGGRYGRINNRDYGTTLRLAREADRYNNKPLAHHVRQGSVYGSGIQDMGTLVDRPKIETMETRAMDQSFELDTNQKRLAQALQDAVNHKDLDAFQQLYKQLYGIELDKMKAEMEMRKYAHNQLVTDSISRYKHQWEAYFNRYFDFETARYITDLMEADENYAMLASQIVTSATILSQSEALRSAYKTEVMDKAKRMGYNDQATAALGDIVDTMGGLALSNKIGSLSKTSQRLGQRMEDNAWAKGVYNQFTGR